MFLSCPNYTIFNPIGQLLYILYNYIVFVEENGTIYPYFSLEFFIAFASNY